MRILLVACVCLIVTSAAFAQERVAFVGPTTGPVSQFGVAMLRGQEAAIRALNNEGGLLQKKIEPVRYDTQCEPTRAAEHANKIASDNIVVVIGHVCTAELVAAAPIYARHGILVISPGVQGPLGSVDRTQIFRLAPVFSRQISLLVDYLKQLGNRSVGIVVIDEKGTYAEVADGFARAAKQITGKIEGPFKLSRTADVNSIAAQIPASYAGAVTLVAAPLDLSQNILRALSVRKLPTTPVVILLNFDPGPPMGSLMLSPGSLLLGFADPRKEKFAQPAAGSLKEFGVLDSVAAFYGYAGVEVWANAVRAAKAFEPAKLSAVLRQLKAGTALGPVSFGNDGDARETDYGFYKVDERGQAVALTSYGGRPPPPPPPPPN